MRTPLAGVLILLTAGCAGTPQPVQLTGPTPATSSQALNCAANELTRLGYTVAPMSAGADFVRGTHINPQPWWRKVFGFHDTADQITASTSGSQLQVTAVSSDPQEAGDAVVQSTATTPGAARSDAQDVLRTCTK